MWQAATHTCLCYVVLCDRCSTVSSASARSLLHYSRNAQMFPRSHRVPHGDRRDSHVLMPMVCDWLSYGQLHCFVSRRPLTKEAEVRYRDILCEISDAKSGAPGTSFFPLSLVFHHFSTLRYIYMLLLPGRQMGEAWEPCTKQILLLFNVLSLSLSLHLTFFSINLRTQFHMYLMRATCRTKPLDLPSYYVTTKTNIFLSRPWDCVEGVM